MASLQIIQLLGNVGVDPETREVGESTVASFRMAVNGRDKEAPPTWYRINAWGKLGDIVQEYVTKGMQVYVSGELRANAYLTKDEEPAVGLDVNANIVQFLGDNKSEDSDDDERRPAKSTAKPGSKNSKSAKTSKRTRDDDVPF